MSANDLIHLEAHFKDWLSSRGKELPAPLKKLEPFLYYSIDQVLKPYNLLDEDTEYGITDHKLDGGVDAFYFLANRNTLIRDDSNTKTAGTTRLRLVIMQVKSSLNETGFKEIDIEKLRLFSDDLLDLSRDATTLKHKYWSHLLTIMRTFKQRYVQLAGNFPSVAIDYYYITRGDETELDQTCTEAVDRLRETVSKYLPDATCQFYPINTQVLLTYLKRRKEQPRIVTWSDAPLFSGGVYVGLMKLADYVEFLKGDDGELNELLFESNVRGYQRNTPVNKEIRATLDLENAKDEREKKRKELDFWLVNNGVTIISSGKLGPLPPRQLSVDDPQIVNGLQTSREIFNYYKLKRDTGGIAKDSRSVLVRVIQVDDDIKRDTIIKATNSQNAMSKASLRATEFIHHQIDDLFKQFHLFYDRRKGFYKDQGESIASIVSVTEVVQAFVSMVLHRPDDARARPGDYISKDKEYLKVFKRDAVPLSTYLKCVKIGRAVDNFLNEQDTDRGEQRNVKFYVAYYLACDLSRKLNPSANDILSLDTDLMSASYLGYCYGVVSAHLAKLSETEDNPDSIAKGPDLLKAIRDDLALTYEEHEEKAVQSKKRKVRDTLKDAYEKIAD